MSGYIKRLPIFMKHELAGCVLELAVFVSLQMTCSYYYYYYYYYYHFIVIIIVISSIINIIIIVIIMMIIIIIIVMRFSLATYT